MKLMFTSDVHYPQYWQRLSLKLEKERPDLLVIAGDLTASGNMREFDKLFKLVKRHTNLWYVLGNHDLWLSKRMLRKGLNSLDKMESVRRMASNYGFLDLHLEGPQKLGSLSLVGVMGWYDYSYAQGKLEQFLRGSPYECDPLSKYNPCSEWWNDKVWVRLPFSDPEFARINADLLRERLYKVDRAVVVMHHVPKEELLVKDRGSFYSAYHGSPLLGKALEDFREKLVFVGYGHDHEGRKAEINGVKYEPLAIPSRDPLVLELP